MDESTQIRICRVLCIFFMMSVHVNPGLHEASVVTTGGLSWLGTVWAGLLGRASVAALSFISGYLLIRTASDRSLQVVARRRFQTLIVPMLTWNLIFCMLQAGKAIVIGGGEESMLLQPDSDPIASLTGLTGPTANLSLFFLRDLFVSALLVHLLRSMLSSGPILVLGVLALMTVFDLTAPVVFRPSILFFVAAGAVYAGHFRNLVDGLVGRPIMVITGLLAAALLVVAALSGGESAPVREMEDLLRRGLLVILVLVTSAVIVDTRPGRWFLPVERRIFETYLLHAPLMGIVWVAWTRLVEGPEDLSYVLFFLLMPVVAIVIGMGFGALCDRAPEVLQMLLRGKVRRPASRTRVHAE